MSSNSNLEFRKIKSLKFLYEVNENGTIFRNVKSKKQNKIKLDFHHSKKGYYATFCRIDGKPTRVMIHKVVAECWLGDKPDGLEVDHIDRDSHNNHYTNLRYVTKSEQMKNRDHSNISATGANNLRIARNARKVRVVVESVDELIVFGSIAACARYLATVYNIEDSETFRWRLKNRRSKIRDYDIYYLNAETIHDGPTGQEIVHNNVI